MLPVDEAPFGAMGNGQWAMGNGQCLVKGNHGIRRNGWRRHRKDKRTPFGGFRVRASGLRAFRG